jgi:hypothetical protein
MLLVNAPNGEECIVSSNKSIWWLAIGWISMQLVIGKSFDVIGIKP